jgi:hypothetical protein
MFPTLIQRMAISRLRISPVINPRAINRPSRQSLSRLRPMMLPINSR